MLGYTIRIIITTRAFAEPRTMSDYLSIHLYLYIDPCYTAWVYNFFSLFSFPAVPYSTVLYFTVRYSNFRNR